MHAFLKKDHQKLVSEGFKLSQKVFLHIFGFMHATSMANPKRQILGDTKPGSQDVESINISFFVTKEL